MLLKVHFRNKHEPRKRRERRRIECVCVKPKVCTKVEKVDAKYGSENLPFIFQNGLLIIFSLIIILY